MVEPQVVIIHPLVLLSTVDHYNRVAKNAKGRRVVGVLLGEKDKRGRIDVTNSFGVPFEEDKRDPNVWFVDHNYVEEMANMFRKVSGKERVVGFYSTGCVIVAPLPSARYSSAARHSRASPRMIYRAPFSPPPPHPFTAPRCAPLTCRLRCRSFESTARTRCSRSSTFAPIAAMRRTDFQ